MKMKGRKVVVFFINLIVFVGLFLFMALKAPSVLNGLGSVMIFSIVLNGAIFIGGNSLDKLTMSKHFRKELFTGGANENDD